jgi:hypothetical protein
MYRRVQSRRSAADSDRVFATREIGEGPFKLFNHGTRSQPVGAKDLDNCVHFCVVNLLFAVGKEVGSDRVTSPQR